MAKRKTLISDFDALRLKQLSDQWKQADTEITRVREEIARIKDFCRDKLIPLQFREGELYHEKRVAELEMTRIITELVDQPTD